MIKFFSILALTFLFIPIERSNADYDWIPFNDEDENVISYIDMNSIERVDDIIYYWLLLDYKEPQTLKSKPNRTVLSTIGYRQLFCNQMGRRSVRSEFYSEKMGKGELVEEYDYPYDYPINHYKPSEKGYQYWSNVCDNTKKSSVPQNKIDISVKSSVNHNWGYAGSDKSGKIIFYMDMNNIVKSNQFIFTYNLLDFSTAGNELWPHKNTILSAVTYQQSDCNNMRFKILELTTFSGSMGQDNIVSSSTKEGSWNYPESDKMPFRVMKNICASYNKIPEKKSFNRSGQSL